MPTFTPNELIEHATAVLVAAGTPPDKAGLVAGLLVEANRAGHDSHGVIRLPQYLALIEKEEIVPVAEVEIVGQTPIMAVVEGNWGFGQVTMSRATELGLDKARQTGMAAIAVRQANHIGRLGSYVDQIARQGMVGMMFVNAVGVPQFRMGPLGRHRAEARHRSSRFRDSAILRADRHRHDHDRGCGGQGQGCPQPRSGNP